jgi:DNA polymerase beta
MNETILEEFKKFLNHVRLEYLFAVMKNDNKEIKMQAIRLRVVKNIYNILKNYKNVITSGKQLENIEGIGKNTIKRIDEILKTGHLSLDTQNLSKEVLALGILESIHGIGSKKAFELVKKKIYTIEDLKKSNIELSDQAKLGIKYYDIFEKIIPRAIIDKIYQYLKKINDSVIITGSYRRGQATSSDIDVLVFNNNDFLNKLVKDKFLIDHLTSLNTKTKYMGYCKFEGKIYRIDVRFFDEASRASALLYFTGPKELNTLMRRKAKAMGLLLNEYGVYKNKKRLNVNSEEDIFKELGMKYLKENERNNYHQLI